MIKLPNDLSLFNQSFFDALNSATTLQSLLDHWAKCLTTISEVKEVIFSYWSEPECVFSIASSREIITADIQFDILACWKESGLHDHILHDLKNRNVAISLSSYTWNYPATSAIKMFKGIDLNFPRPYAIMIPFSSGSQFTLSSDSNFYGYAGLFFDEFPQMNENIVQPVISLPNNISAALCAFVRKLPLS